MPDHRTLAVVAGLILTWPSAALSQVIFEPNGCDFGVWFVSQPTITNATVPIKGGEVVETTIGELNAVLDDGYAHYFRAECTQIVVGSMSEADLIEDMTTLAQMNQLQGAKIWIENFADDQMIGRIRASINSGQRVYFFDIRRYVSETSVFDAWAGAERFPTEGIVMFFRSAAYRGSLLHE